MLLAVDISGYWRMHSKVPPRLLILAVGSFLFGTLLTIWNFSPRPVAEPAKPTASVIPAAAPAEGSSIPQANWQTLAGAFVRSDEPAAKKMVGSPIAFTAEMSSFGTMVKARTSDEDKHIASLWTELADAAQEVAEDRKPLDRFKGAGDRLSAHLNTLPRIPCVIRASPEATKKYLGSGGSLSWCVNVTGILRRVDLRRKCIWVEAVSMSGGEVRL